MLTTVTVRAQSRPLWLCFEPWATEYTVAPGTAVVIHFDSGTDVELTHHDVGLTFLTFGRHPDIWSEDGRPLEILSDRMPRTPDGLSAPFRWIVEAVPPVRPLPDMAAGERRRRFRRRVT